MYPNLEDALAPQRASNPTAGRRAERSSSPSASGPWAVVRQVLTHSSRYIETRIVPFGPYPLHEHEAPGIALLLRGALEVTYVSGHRLAGDARERAGALVLPVGLSHRGR